MSRLSMDRPASARHSDPRFGRALMVAVAMSLTYLFGALVAWVKPFSASHGMQLPGSTRVLILSVAASWVVVLVIWAVGLRPASDPASTGRLKHALQVVSAIVLILPFTVEDLHRLVQHPGTALICLPSTGFALWIAYQMQRYHRMPVWLLLALFGWGALVAGGFGGAMNFWFQELAPVYLQDAPTLQDAWDRIYTGLALNASIFEELGKAAGLAMAYFLFRRQFSGIVSGLVLGASVGLGFNFIETVLYMNWTDWGTAGFQYWMRQSVGLMGAHVAFSAIAGAGFGVARQIAEPLPRGIAIGSGLLAAVGGHFINDIVLLAVRHTEPDWLPSNDVVNVLVAQPLLLLVLQGPFVVIYLLMLRGGLRAQAFGLTTEMTAEARTGRGAITAPEIDVLMSPSRRLWFTTTVLRRHGPAAYRVLNRLHVAQFDLAMQRWHASREDPGDQDASVEALRDQVLRLKGRQAIVLDGAREAEVTA